MGNLSEICSRPINLAKAKRNGEIPFLLLICIAYTILNKTTKKVKFKDQKIT